MDQLEDQADEVLLEDPAPPRAGLRQRARDLLSPLPEDSWVTRPRIQDQADPEATQTSLAPDAGDSDYGLSVAGGSTGSTDAGGVKGWREGSALFYGTLIKALLAASSGLANLALRDAPDDQTWLMDRKEAKGMSKPLGRIASRHAPLPVGKGAATDVGDALQAGVALAGYIARALGERAERRRGPQALNPLDQGQQQ